MKVTSDLKFSSMKSLTANNLESCESCESCENSGNGKNLIVGLINLMLELVGDFLG